MKSKKLSALLLAGLMTASAVSFTEIIPCTKFTSSATSVPIEYPDDTSGEFGENLTWSIDSEGTLTIDGEGDMVDSEGEIPDYVEGAPWDYHYDSIKKIVIGDKVGALVYEFIIGYPNLTAIEVGEDNKYHSSDKGILYNKDKTILINCPEKNSIKEYTIPDSVKTINGTAFSFCQNLEEITIPDSVTRIGSSAFHYCKNLSVVNLSKNIEILGYDVFLDTPWLKKQKSENPIVCINGVLIDGKNISDVKEFPEDIRVIGGSAFENNTKLTELTLPETATHISQFAFFHNETLQSVTIPDSVIHLGEGAFSQCSELKEVTIGNGITELPLKTFYLCKTLNKVKISETVKKIDEMAFWGCYDLTSIDIPENVEFIGEDVFDVSSLWEPALETITIRNPKCELSEDSIPEKTTIYGYKGSTAQEYAEKYNRTFIDIESDDTQLTPISGKCGENASFVLDSEGTLTISGTGTVKQPQELYESEENAIFLQTPKYSVKKIVIEEGISEIGMQAFNKLSEVTSLTLPKSLQIINSLSFEGCTSLKSVKIPDSVTSLGLFCFANCTSLEEVILPNNDEYTCISPFGNCDNLNNIVLGDKTTHIPEFLFSKCSGLKEITIPDGIKNIEIAAFEGCVNLKSVKIINPKCELSEDSIPEKTTIYGYKGSTAQEYAGKYNRTFIDIESDDIQLTPTLLGDANCDGVVSIADATAILQSIGNPDKYALSEQGAVNADIADTGNGITVDDAVKIQKVDAEI
ncbi:MAG: leucine-rich repeat protein [Ruminococcus sp.]|nr:leucine-rich repeat protein [Ruminococcus sp.]